MVLKYSSISLDASHRGGAVPHPRSVHSDFRDRQAGALLRWHNEFESIWPEHSSQPGHG